MARAWFLRVLLNSSSSQRYCDQSPASLGRAPAELSEPCSPQPQGIPRLPQELLAAPPSRSPCASSVCRAHGWNGHRRRADQAGP